MKLRPLRRSTVDCAHVGGTLPGSRVAGTCFVHALQILLVKLDINGRGRWADDFFVEWFSSD